MTRLTQRPMPIASDTPGCCSRRAALARAPAVRQPVLAQPALNTTRRKCLPLLLLPLAAMAGCSPSTPKPATLNTDLQPLGRLVTLPVPALTAQWETAALAQGSAPGPDDWQLWAVIDVGAAARQKLLDAAPALSGGERVFPARLRRPWFPPALAAHFEAQADGSLRLRDAPRDAAAFFSAPLLQGFWLPFGDGGELLLVLQTS